MLVGRQAEQRRIAALVSSARIGESGVLVITGEPGIGKTSLLRYAIGCADTMRVLSVTGSENERDLPFAGLAQLLRLTPSDLERLPPPQAQALGVALAVRSGSDVDRFAVGAGLLTWLTQSSDDGPICLVVDDAHLLDLPSQEALAFVARRLLADAVALVAGARADEPCRLVVPDLPQLPLTGIDVAATRELIDLRRAGTQAPDLSGRLHDLCGGNPLAILELAGESDQPVPLLPDAPVPVPATLSDLYGRRSADLTPPASMALLVAAIAGEDLSTIALACARLGGTAGDLAEAEEAGLVSVQNSRVRFTHPLVRSALYAAASSHRRREVHAIVADVLPDREIDRRAWHRSAATIGPDEPTAAALEAVAQRAANRGAYSVAASAADRAAALTPHDRERAARWLSAGIWAWQAGDAVRARDLLGRASQLHPSSATAVRADQLRGVISARCGALSDARDTLLAAGDASATAEDKISCWAEAVNACFYLGDAATALAAARRIEATLPEADSATSVLGMMAAGMGRVLAGEGGTSMIVEAVSRPTGHGERLGLDDASWQALAPLFIRDSTTGRDLMRQVVAERRAQSAIGSLPHLLFHIARDGAATNRWSNAEADYTEAIALAREFGQSTELAASLAGLAWLEARQGRAQAGHHADEAAALCERFDMHVSRVWALLARADLAHGAGSVAEASDRYRAVVELLDRIGVRDVDLTPLPELVETRLMLFDRDSAQAMAEEYLRRAEAKGQPWALARARRTCALVCADAEAEAHFAAALELHAATLDAYEEARTRLAYGAWLRRHRRRVDARVPLRAALNTFTQLGAQRWAEASADELSATGMTLGKPGHSPVVQLTPRELQVAVLLAESRTTRQVATALFLSPKTVEYHLRHIYLKFGIESRTELASRMAETGPSSELTSLSAARAGRAPDVPQ